RRGVAGGAGRFKRDELFNEFLRDRIFRGGQCKYENGQREALMEAILWWICEKWPAPPWVIDAFDEAPFFVKKSWDEVFDPPIPKGEHHYRRDRNRKIGEQLADRIGIAARQEGRSITGKLFEEVGKEFGVSGSVARDLYYENKRSQTKFVERFEATEREFEAWLRERGEK